MYLGLNNLGLNSISKAFSPTSLFLNNEPGFHGETYDPNSLLRRRNLLTWTEDVTNAAYAKVGTAATPDATTVNLPAANDYLYRSISSEIWRSSTGTMQVELSGSGSVSIGFYDNVAGFQITNVTLSATPTVFTRTATLGVGATDVRLVVAGRISGASATTATVSKVGLNAGATAHTYQKVTDWDTEYLASVGAANVFMWQDAAGTTPVTAVEQPVGKWNDRSGNAKHATQATSGSRPILSARYNLLTKSEQFDDAAWTKNRTSVAPNAVAAPAALGSGTIADTLTADGTAGSHYVLTAATFAAAPVKARVWAKAGTNNFMQVFFSGDLVSYVNFDLATGAVGTSGGTATGTIESAGGGWYLCTVTNTSTTSVGVGFAIASAANDTRILGNSLTTTIHLVGSDCRTAADAALNIPAYQRVNTSTDYATDGFIHYLKFDGTDDGLATPAIDFSGVDKMAVWAGVTKLSDAAVGMVAELTTAWSTSPGNNGAWYLTAPNTLATADFGSGARGTAAAGATLTSVASPYAAPHSAVLTAVHDIAGDSTITRVNSVAAATATADKGAGNFKNDAIYIGRRNNTSLPAAMRMTSATVRGTTVATPSPSIASMEQYAAAKAGLSFAST